MMSSPLTFRRLFLLATIILSLVIGIDATQIMRRPDNYKQAPHRFSIECNPKTNVIQRRQVGAKVSIAYFTNWGIYGANFQPTDIVPGPLTHILYAFADADQSSGAIMLTDLYADEQKHFPGDSWNEPGNNLYGCLKQLYLLKLEQRNLKVLLSIGGWTYSQSSHFDFVTSASARATFVSNAVQLVQDYGFDGIDIDFEYPSNSAQGQGFADLMTSLRIAFDNLATSKGDTTPYLLTAAVAAGPANYANLVVPQMDAAINFWNLMAYDYAGSWLNFTDNQANLYGGARTGFNTDSAVKFYLGAGASTEKLVMGMPLYGHAFENTSGLGQPYSGIGPGTITAGIYSYKTLPLAGAQVFENTTDVSSYSYDSTKKELVSYDTPDIVTLKAQYIHAKALGGSMFWDLSTDKTGADSLVGTVANVLGQLDQTQNHINYPTSKWDNIRNNMGQSSTTTSIPPSTPPATTTGSTPVTTGPSGSCVGVAAWASTVVYTGGQQATFGNHLWTAKWWTQGDTPGGTVPSQGTSSRERYLFYMNSNDLFSFLDEAREEDDSDHDNSMDVETNPPTLNNLPKRKVDNLLGADEKNVSTHKKQRLSSPKPVVLDDFETEAKREVAASAGLTGAAETGSRLELKHQVRHQVAVPQDYNYIPISKHVPPTKPDREYKFELDPFQKVSVYAIQRNESVLVSAHTSAGKTVVAEYAIAQCLNRKQRVIYTSPIKALSNQKYREMLAEFGDVGLMTGDVTINPSATCLVMTTEILRSMLYRGSEIMREVAWVIFDEIHYMRDKERGVVWEETIILLPHSVRYVFLSATIPNAMQFAEWISKSHDQACHVVYTDFRPTPLQHYLFPAGGEGIYLVVNEKGEFREDNFSKAMGKMQDNMGEDPADPKSGRGSKGKSRKGYDKKGPSDISKIIKMIMLKNYNPVIVFSFSKRECEGLALTMSKFEFNSSDEQELVTNIFNNAIDNLAQDDRQLPQIITLLPLLRRGIGIHHGGLLPILKEVIEILFQEGLIKVLFATETFSIGLNMPAKTVVFTAARKFDGREFRNISSGEYIQMSGRAGRRGLDDRGVVIMMCDEKLEPVAAKEMVKGEADRLDSAFHLGYNMILNLMKVEGISPEYMLERCFFQFQSSAGVPKLEEELEREEEAQSTAVIPDEALVSQYYDCRQQLDEMVADFREVITHPTYSLPFLKNGRLVKVKYQKLDFGWGIVINFQKRLPPKNKLTPKAEELPPHEQYVIDVLLNCAPGSTVQDRTNVVATPSGVQPCAQNQKGVPLVVPVLLSIIEGISHLRIHLPQDLRSEQARETVWKSVLEVHRRMPDGIPLLDPIENMGIKDVKFKELVKKIEVMEQKMTSNPLHKDPRLPELYTLFVRKKEVQQRIRDLKKRIQATHDVLQMEELKCRKRVLRRLAFTTSADIVDMKGRVACEISSGDELLLTELIFNGVFNPLSPEQSAALLSCFVFTEKSEQATKLKEELAAPLRIMQEIARRIAKVSKESKLAIEEDDYVSSFKVELMDTVVQWCRGASFSEICKLTDQFEGSLIRVFRRLGELLRQMAQAAKVIGNSELKEKFEKASEMLERPNSVIFCSSLYL